MVKAAKMDKNMKYKAECNMKILKKHSGIDVMLVLTDFIFDVFVESLRNENPNITQNEINQKIKEVFARERNM
jgi:hypothetical protein